MGTISVLTRRAIVKSGASPKIVVSKDTILVFLYILLDVLTTVSQVSPLFLFQAVFCEVSRSGIMPSSSSNNMGEDAWLMQMELMREEEEEVTVVELTHQMSYQKDLVMEPS